MIKGRVLALEPREYYLELGVCEKLESAYDVVYGLSFTLCLDNRLKGFDFVVSCIYHSSSSQYIAMRANYLGVQTVFMSDGIGDWSNFFQNKSMQLSGQALHSPMIHRLHYCCDKTTAHYLKEKGANVRLYIPDRVCKDVPAGDVMPGYNNLDTVLITTANNPFFNSDERARLVGLLIKIRDDLEALEKKVAVRIFDDDLYRECFDGYENVKNGSFAQCVSKFSLVVTTPSSLVVQCASLAVPVCILDYRSSPLFVQGVCRYTGQIPWSDIEAELLPNLSEALVFQSSQFAKIKFGGFEGEEKTRPEITPRKKQYLFFSFEFFMRLIIKKFGLTKKIKSLLNGKKA